ncbi:BJ4_G0004780.mRNA.1.CDS.1 [Saccharomyces cerevisiae]|nr:BJ4_G0004780.mRNA.1.CDS.1 [Saccharomyces cerevisiae]
MLFRNIEVGRQAAKLLTRTSSRLAWQSIGASRNISTIRQQIRKTQLYSFKKTVSIRPFSLSSPVFKPHVASESNPIESRLKTSKNVAYWLIGTSGLVFGIVVLGGLTRLTESGLSITEWKPSMQFAEIKSSVLKKFDKEGFFQITIADVVERFKLTLLLSITGLRNLQSWSSSLSNTSINFWSPRSTLSIVINILCGPMVSVVGSEVLVDWAKHAYITKFNRIRPQIYDKFYYIIYKDYSTRTHKLEDRLGLPLPAFVVLFIVMVRPTLFKSSEPSYLPSLFRILFMGASVFLLALLAKFTLDLILIKWSKRIEQRFRDQALNTVVTEEEYVPGLLSGGMGKVDVSTRIALHSDYNKENRIETESVSPMRKRKTTSTAECTPPSLNDIRRQKDSKNPRSLENVARYKMVSKRIW